MFSDEMTMMENSCQHNIPVVAPVTKFQYDISYVTWCCIGDYLQRLSK